MKKWNGLVVVVALSSLAALTISTSSIAQTAPASPAQSSVASKTAKFGATLAADPALAKALEAHDLAGAQKLVGKPGAFQGTVTSTYSPKTHDIMIVDFDKQYKTALTAIIASADYAKFPDLATLEGKHVMITGTFTAPKGKPQINLSDPAQVKIIQ